MSARRERGVALLTAILAVALATILVAALLDRAHAGLARTRNLERAEQADALALGLEEWAMQLLLRDLANDAGVDARADTWAQPLPPTEVPGGRVMGRMEDRNGCFNLNNLVAGGQRVPSQMQRFARLLRALKLDPALAEAVADWIDPDFDSDARGAEDNRYLQARVPYRAANQPMAHVSELKLVRGVDTEVYALLQPHVCALRPGTVLNVNTATVPVLMSLADGMTEALARRIVEGGNRYRDVAAFQQELTQYGIAVFDSFQIGVASDYFVARAQIELDGIEIGYSSLIERRPGSLRVLARSRGPL